MVNDKLTVCETCAHAAVCKNTEWFLEFQKAVDEVYITHEGPDGENLVYLKHVDWIGPPNLVCHNYDPKKNQVNLR